ncbi:hypothetical protein N665_0042s0027 [Sinapis alba]|nr:hypothetical protein N665_0042s0027 [Sinapis alba]
MQNANHSGRLSKWAVELSEYDVTFQNRPAAKSQVLADFLIELTPELDKDLHLPSDNWILHVDGSSSVKGSGIGIHLQSPTGELLQQSFRLGFQVSNNEAEYEFLIAGLCLARAIQARRIHAYCDSQLSLIISALTLIPHGEKDLADALAVLGSSPGDQVKRTILVEHIDRPSITLPREESEHIAAINTIDPMDTGERVDQPEITPPDWRVPFLQYLSNGSLPGDKWEARRLKAKSSNYVILDGRLHRWTSATILLTCVNSEETELVMAETHEGVAGNHSGG